MFFKIVFRIVQALTFLIFPYKVIGKENVPDGKLIVCGNHNSLRDPLFIAFGIGLRDYAFMGKAELFQNKLFGAFLKKMHAFPVHRGKADIAAVKTALRALKNNQTLLLFPEGTRVALENADTSEAKAGVGMFAKRTGTPVLPVYVRSRVWIFHRPLVVIGKPMDFSNEKDLSYIEIANQVMAEIRRLKKAYGPV